MNFSKAILATFLLCSFYLSLNFAGFTGWNSSIGAATTSSFDCNLDNPSADYWGISSAEDACAAAFSGIGATVWTATSCSSLGTWTAYECSTNATTNQFYLGNATETSVDVL